MDKRSEQTAIYLVQWSSLAQSNAMDGWMDEWWGKLDLLSRVKLFSICCSWMEMDRAVRSDGHLIIIKWWQNELLIVTIMSLQWTSSLAVLIRSSLMIINLYISISGMLFLIKQQVNRCWANSHFLFKNRAPLTRQLATRWWSSIMLIKSKLQ